MILLTQCEGSFFARKAGGKRLAPFKLMSLPPTMAAFRPDYQRAYYQVTLCVAAGKPVPPALYQPRIRPIEEWMEEEVFYDSTCIF